MQPIGYGYLVVRSSLTRQDREARKAALSTYAEDEGYTLALIFEEIEGSTDALSAVIGLARDGRASVLIGALSDLGMTPRIQARALCRIKDETGTQVLILDPMS